MKISDLITHAQKKMPKYTAYFSNKQDIVSLVANDKICTATTKEKHNLKIDDLIVIEGAKVSNEIVSLTQNHGLGTLITKYPHEVTKNSPLRKGDSTHIEIFNANEEAYNGKFLILNIPDTNTIEFSIDSNAPYQATGNPEIKEEVYANFNGRQQVTKIIDDYTFNYELPYVPATNEATGNIILKHGIRISGDYNVQNAISAYEEQGANDLWGFVVLDGANVSKSKVNGTDAISEFTRGAETHLELIQDVSFFVFIPTSQDYCWIDQIDILQELRTAVLKTFHNARFKSGIYDEDCYLSYIGDNPVDTTGTAYAIYQYKFQTTLNIYNDDGVEPEFAPRMKKFEIHEKNNLEKLEGTPEYISKGDLPNESVN